ncbi:hypothetical protein ISU10_01725 [Nocardioides agariphilus]|uniref:Uncharacterized protein n=1 Tax=Nocardioides agariphilus TaxID=433664 RepID=A0A930YH06_9ACTN|nr:hypothetical protein [Nocardioides agariphilus]MBF4766483.1 hypothetical protein [Nocardioides agariphilus]
MSPRSDLDTQLRDLLDERLEAVAPPGGNMGSAVARGRVLRRRRRLLTGGAGAAALVAVAAVGAALMTGSGGGPRPDTAVEPLGQMDFSHGLQAYGDPGYTLHIGGRTVDASGLEWLDTDAVATEQGVVYYARGDLLLVQEDGTTKTLDKGARTPGRFRPTAKADASEPLVAYALEQDDAVVLKVIDTARDKVVASRVLDCGSCRGLVIDGIDSGAVFVRDADGTSIWRYGDSDELVPFAGSKTRVADVRSGTVLYDGPAPDTAESSSWHLVRGAIDAQLTYDGKYVLYWSSTLEPTDPSGSPVVLEQPPGKRSGFWSIDTDGTVLVAAPDKNGFTIYDCEVPAGACEELGPLDPKGGDPMFIGNDM